MMASPINLVLFGDQTVEKLSSIQSLVRNSRTSAGAKRLLREATDTLQIDLAKLSREDRAWNFEINTLISLAEDNVSEENRNGVIATVLMCIGRLGELIVYAEEDPSILGSEQNPVQALAFCTGLLPASALVAARDTSELFDIGIEIVSITFRMAYEIIRRMKLIEESKRSWALTVVGKTPEKVQPILDKFHNAKKIPYPKRIAVGVVSNGWLTLMGAPSSISSLMEFSKEMEEAPKTPTDSDGAVHTNYMPRFDIDKVLGTSPLLETPITSKARMISPGSCKRYNHTSLRSMLTEVMLDIAHNILHINGTIEECLSGFSGKDPVSLTVVGPTAHLSAVQRHLQSRGTEYHVRQHRSPQSDIVSRAGSDLVAIVGMAGRFPGSENVEDFFDDLLDGHRQIKRIPTTRFSLDDYFDSSGKKRNTTSTNDGAFLDNPGHFDNRLFNISPREATQMDPIQRLLFMTSYEALQSAGYSKDGTLATESNRIATYFGQASEDWRDVLNNEDIDIYYVPSLSRPFGPSRLSFHHKWGGGTYALDAACASSTTAIHLACSALKARECDTALAGGGSILVSPNTFAGLNRSGMISDSNGCRTYHDDADGYVRGEGVGIVVLKRLEDAYADNDNILGIIRGSARTYTSTSSSITHPSAESQSRIYNEILHQTGVVPNEIAYVEMHGTGTQAGDLEEMTSVINVMGRGRSNKNTLTVGAVKANLGHGEGAAGITSLLKVLMMMREKKIPPQPGIPFKLNHNFPNLEKLHVQIAGLPGKSLALRPSPAAIDKKIKCIVNSFDASGGNTSLVVEQAPEPSRKADNPLPCHVVCISAKTAKSLKDNRRRLLDYLVRNSRTKLADLAYTMAARRMHEPLRVAYSVTSLNQITSLLREDVSKEGSDDPKSKPPTINVILAFTGQGSQYSGMGRTLYQHSSAFRDFLHTCQQIAHHQNLPDFIHLIIDEKSDMDNVSAASVQLAIVTLEITMARLLKTWGISPDIVTGHSLGEYSALCVGGVLSVSDTLFLVGRRAKLMESQLTAGVYSMLAVSKAAQDVRQLLASGSGATCSRTTIACMNAPQVTVVSGPVKEIEDLKTILEHEGSRATLLRVPYGFHSGHIEPIIEDFGAIASGIVFSAPTTPIASTLLGEVVPIGKHGVFSPSYLTRQAREPVNYIGAIKACNATGFVKPQTHWVEVGPEPVCLGLIRRTLDISSARLLSTMKSKEDNWLTISCALATLYKSGASINWPQYYSEFKGSLNLLTLPTYAFDVKDFWTPYVNHVARDKAVSLGSDTALLNGSTALAVPAFSTTSLQWIEAEEIEGQNISVTFSSHTSEPSLYKAIQGHVVNHTTVCSLSIFCDMAKSAAQYAYHRLRPSEKVPTMTIHNLDMAHALVVPELDPSLIVKTTISYSATGNRATVTFRSTNSGVSSEHGHCDVGFEDSSMWFSRQVQTAFLIKARIQSLRDMSYTGKAHRLLKPVFYKLFDNLVTYGKDYQGVEEAWIDTSCHDAVCSVRLLNTASSGNFLYNPFWIDASIHLAGFLVNGGLSYGEDIACLSTGFESWQTLTELRADNTYTTYVSMLETEKANILSGSAYVYDSDDKLVQVTTGIKFMKLKKVVLTSVLRPGLSSSTRPNEATAKPSDVAATPTLPKPVETESITLETESSDGSKDGKRTPIDDSEASDLFDTFLTIVASESGYNVDDMELATAFADMGMDSLMAITILATVQRDTGVELAATFLLDHPTVGDAKVALYGDKVSESALEPATEVANPRHDLSLAGLPISQLPPQTYASQIDAERPILPSSTSTTVMTEEKIPMSVPESKVVLLHGSLSSTGSKVFLLPDGSGSAYQYIQIPALGTDVNVYGLESPFLASPAAYTCSLEVVCGSFAAAIVSTQPRGPYVLAGFSLGAIYTYEIAKQLLHTNELIAGIILIDLALPCSIDADLSVTHEQLREIGYIPSFGRQSNKQKAHIVNTVRAMLKYRFGPCASGQRPNKTIVISSKDKSVVEGQSDLAKWARGHDSAFRGWELMVGPVETHEVAADHLSLLKPPAVNDLGALLASVLSDSISGA